MRYYIVNYLGEVLGDFGSYTAARLHLDNFSKQDIDNLELEIIDDEYLGDWEDDEDVN